MKPICAICGRRTEPFVMIGNAVIGPKCAQRAGLMPLAQRKSGLVIPVIRRRIEKPQHPQTPDLFDEVPA
ncbi:MAG: hypothetical protein C0449_21545 [Polaromonas sp.]|nr:hypothetical protein [Polaromonas sp.]